MSDSESDVPEEMARASHTFTRLFFHDEGEKSVSAVRNRRGDIDSNLFASSRILTFRAKKCYAKDRARATDGAPFFSALL